MKDFKKGGPLQNSNIFATNRLFVKNPLFKKKKKKRAPGVYNPKGKFKYEDGGSIIDLTEEEIQKYIDGGYVVEEVNDPSIPALNTFDKGGPKSRKLKRNKKEITEVEAKPIEVLDPSQEVFDLPKTQTGELYYEPITTKETTQEELDAIIQYNKEQKELQKEQERLQAIETAKVNEPKYYDEGLQFVKDWHNSDMYNQMVLNSFQGNQKNADYLTSVRKKNLEDLPGLNIQEKEAENQADGIQPAAWSKTNSGLVEVFPGGYEYGPSLYVHELIHSGDRPRELYKYNHPAYKTGLPIDYFSDKGINLGGSWTTDENNNVVNYPDWMFYKDPRFPNDEVVWHDRVIPQTDNLYITTHRGANWKDNEAYKIAQKEGLYSPQGRGEDYYKNKMINDWGYDPNSPDFNTDLQWYVNYDKDDAKQRLKNAPSEWKTFAHDYVSTPHEVRARLGEIRYFGKKEGVYDPFTEQITPEIFQQYINKEREDDNWQPMKPINELREDYTDEEILWMLQNISKNKHEKEGDEFAPQSTKYGGSLKRFIDGGEEDCREGYMKNENGHCVPSVAPEQVDADEWYRNWYANRVIQDEEGQKLLNEARPKILKRAEKFPEVQYFEESGPEAGYYSPKTGNIKLNSTLVGNNPFLKNEVLFHEKGHYLTYPSLKDPEMDTYKKMLQHPIHKMKEYETDVIKNALVRKKNVPKKDRKYFKYISGDYGEEISKRIMEMRRLAGFKPDQVITDKDVEDFYKKAAEKGWTNPESDKFVEPLHDLKIYTKSPEEIKNLLNKLAKNEPEQVDEFQPQLAKYGGSKNKYIEVDIPEEEIQWYIDNGYRVEPVSKLKKFIG